MRIASIVKVCNASNFTHIRYLINSFIPVDRFPNFFHLLTPFDGIITLMTQFYNGRLEPLSHKSITNLREKAGDNLWQMEVYYLIPV